MSIRTNRGTQKIGSGQTTKAQTSRTLAGKNNGILNPPAWTNSIRVDTRTQHFPFLSRWTREPQVWHSGGSPHLIHLHARPLSCWVKEPRISHTCTNSMLRKRGPQNSHTRTTTPTRMGMETLVVASGLRGILEFHMLGHSPSVLLGRGTPNLPCLHEFHPGR